MEGSAIWTKFAPYQILLANHGWSVVGRSSLHRGVREFYIRNVQNIQYTDDSYEIPRGFRGRLQARRNQGWASCTWLVRTGTVPQSSWPPRNPHCWTVSVPPGLFVCGWSTVSQVGL